MYREIWCSTSPIITGDICEWFLILIAKGSIAIAKSKGLSGQPWRVPQSNALWASRAKMAILSCLPLLLYTIFISLRTLWKENLLGIKPVWSLCIIELIHLLSLFAKTLVNILISLPRREMGLYYLYLSLKSMQYLPNKVSLVIFSQ